MCKDIHEYTDEEILEHLVSRKVSVWFLKELAEKRKFAKELIDALILEDKLQSQTLTQGHLDDWKAGRAKIVRT